MARHRGGSSPSSNIVAEVISKIQQLTSADKQKLYSEVYTHGDFSQIYPEPNASAAYNEVVSDIQELNEDELDELIQRVSSVLQGGMRKRAKKSRSRRATRKATRRSKKTRRTSYRK